MTFDPSKPVQTRDGRPARILATDIKCDDGFSMAVAVTHHGGEVLGLRRADGRRHRAADESPDDLINVPVRREGWVNIYRRNDGEVYPGSSVFSSREKADAAAAGDCWDRVTCIRIEWEEPA